jgi:hypothetical protein
MRHTEWRRKPGRDLEGVRVRAFGSKEDGPRIADEELACRERVTADLGDVPILGNLKYVCAGLLTT